MIRICGSLANAGYKVKLVGRRVKTSVPLQSQSYSQKRLRCFFSRGKAFYIEFNVRLFFYLLFRRIDCLCAIDLDTILPCYFASKLKKVPRVYDAHELFCEMKEIVTRPGIYAVWKKIERFSVPRFPNGYTVNQQIAAEFKRMYRLDYGVIRNFAVLTDLIVPTKDEKYILYQGAVNEGRSFETLIPAMAQVDCRLIICGDGNFMTQAKEIVNRYQLDRKVIFKGRIAPAKLREFTRNAWIGVTLFENKGMSNYLSLANRFSDYLHAGVPQLCVDYPVYRELNNEYNVAILIKDLEPENIAAELNRLLNNDVLYSTLQSNCLNARKALSWQAEEIKLVSFYNNIFPAVG